MRQTPVTAEAFKYLDGRVMLILPDKDFFSEKAQRNLAKLMRNPEIIYISGGHLSTVLKADEYIEKILAFLARINAER